MIMNAVGVVSGGRCPPAPPAPAEGLSRFRGNFILFLKHRESDMREWGKDDYYSKFTSYSLIKIQIFISEHG